MFTMAWMVFAGMLAATPATDGSIDASQVVIDGKLQTSDGTERDARLAIGCATGRAGVAMQLQLLSTSRLNFDLNGFEGPASLGAKRPTAHISAGSVQAPPLVSIGVYGSRGSAPYAFTVSQAAPETAPPATGKKGKRASKPSSRAPAVTLWRVAQALSTPGTELNWVQDAAISTEKPLTAHFAPESWQAQQIAAQLQSCH
ncbi:hypothetical protein [Dyella sp.]|uniref:hypothetical protein n=1 Tax=Dyella sp. TaxID=1869338 RepID=UPI002ED20723